MSPEASALQPAEPVASVEGLEVPLGQFIRQTAEAVVGSLGLQKPDIHGPQIGKPLERWEDAAAPGRHHLAAEGNSHRGLLPQNCDDAEPAALEQKINAQEGLSDGEKVEFQQYVTRCYGSMTTFNLLFKEKEDYF